MGNAIVVEPLGVRHTAYIAERELAQLVQRSSISHRDTRVGNAIVVEMLGVRHTASFGFINVDLNPDCMYMLSTQPPIQFNLLPWVLNDR